MRDFDDLGYGSIGVFVHDVFGALVDSEKRIPPKVSAVAAFCTPRQQSISLKTNQILNALVYRERIGMV
jgi:hypothetical protein